MKHVCENPHKWVIEEKGWSGFIVQEKENNQCNLLPVSDSDPEFCSEDISNKSRSEYTEDEIASLESEVNEDSFKNSSNEPSVIDLV